MFSKLTVLFLLGMLAAPGFGVDRFVVIEQAYSEG